jgi:DNA helicase HerA-like ATPase
MKQARAYGVGVLVATQNPMDLDYRALSNAGVWFVGRLQTDADRARVVEAASGTRGVGGFEPEEVADAIKRLAPRWFVARNAVPRAGGGSGAGQLRLGRTCAHLASTGCG